ncbi:MAG: BMP family ABC transporter substrate-binding protein, partial [Spirochaetales bacterium]|nr:BMP family ABC transporter substrate-binding protein [Spirochaetales bacterium]
MKKIIIAVLVATVFLAGCAKTAEEKPAAEAKELLKVGMVTDAGTIDDKSFNQGTWEGILEAEKDMDISTKYLKPVGTTEA